VSVSGSERNHPSFGDLLEVENSHEFLEFRCPESGYLLWPLVRNQFFRVLISNLYYPQAPLIVAPPHGRGRQALKALPRVLMSNFGRRGMRGKVLVIATGVGHFLRQGRWFNRISDYFALQLPQDTVTVEGLFDWHIPEPRWNQRTQYWLAWQGIVVIAGHLGARERHFRLARDMIEHACARAQSLLNLSVSSEQIQLLTALTAPKLARLSVVNRVYRHLLKQVKPRVVLVEQGCYGDYGILNHVAREMGIRVAEPQHGMVSAGHDAYNYAPLLRKSDEYRRYLPDDFLSYGAWWNGEINAPLRKWVVGHPHHAEQRPMLSANPQQKSDILLLADGIDFSIYLELAQKLSERFEERYRIVLRPHPLEREKVFSRYPSGRADGVVIDKNLDIYQSFASAHAVVGEMSTGLFEAIDLVERVLLWETPKACFSFPKHPFRGFVTAEELEEEILSDNSRRMHVAANDIWARDWRGNYRRYLDHVLAA